jgi:DNA-binding transcriptional LysR family regulator
MEVKALLTDTEAELLMRFEGAPTLEKLAKAAGRDITVISRQLTRIAAKGDFLMKVGGRWKLTELGHRYNQLHRDFVFGQGALLKQSRSLRIGTNREFAARVLAEDFAKFRGSLDEAEISIVSYDSGVERALLDGEIDIGIDCGRPYSPEVTYRHAATEGIVPVASPQFLKTHRIRAEENTFSNLPHVLCDRLNVDRVSSGKMRAPTIAVRTNDVASARSLCLASIGWAMLPRYCIRRELADKSLRELGGNEYAEKYGVWRLRSRKTLERDFEAVEGWLRNVPL